MKKTMVGVLVAILGTAALAQQGQPETAKPKLLEPGQKWIHWMGNLSNDKGRTELIELMKRGKKAGYNGVQVNDSKFQKFQTQPETYSKAVAEVRAGDPTSSIERSLATSWQFSGEQERRLFDEALGRAGLPRCAPASDLAAVDPKSRLPECEAERAKLSATRS